MKPDLRRGGLVAILAAFSLACTGSGIVAVTLTPTASPPGTPAPAATATPVSMGTPTATIQPIDLPTPFPTETPVPTATPELAWLPGTVHVFPGPLHYAGDLLSFEIPIANIGSLPQELVVRASVDGGLIGEVEPTRVRSASRMNVLQFRWLWDSAGQAGRHTFTFEIPIDGSGTIESLNAVVEILPANRRPAAESGAVWQEHEEFCCQLHTISNTAAGRDIEKIRATARASVSAVEESFGFALSDKPLTIVLLDNVWGAGAYSGSYLAYSYVDRNYVDIDFGTALRHAAARRAARSLNAQAPPILTEGLIMYVAGGRVRPEAAATRTAALVELGLYVPLADLANDFGSYRTETAYSEAGALVEYLVDTYTWSQFVTLYSLRPADNSASSLDSAITLVYGIRLDQLENSFLQWLAQRPAEAVIDNVRLTLEAGEITRRYQQDYAPFQEGLPGLGAALERGITADFTRRPQAVENIAMECMIEAVWRMIREGRYAEAETLLQALSASLKDGDFTRSPVVDYVQITRQLMDEGYEPQRITLDGSQAVIEAVRVNPVLQTVNAGKINGVWEITD